MSKEKIRPSLSQMLGSKREASTSSIAGNSDIPERVVVQEKIVYRDRPNRGINCGNISCLVLLAVVGILVLGVFTLVAQPESLWGPVKGILNNNLASSEFTPVKNEAQSLDLSAKVAGQSASGSDLDNLTITVTEAELAGALNANLEHSRNLAIDLDPGRLRTVANLEDQGSPLWLNLNFGLKDQKFVLLDGGLGLIPLPSLLISPAQSSLEQVLNVFNLGEGSQIFAKLSTAQQSSQQVPQQLPIKSIELRDEYLVITFYRN